MGKIKESVILNVAMPLADLKFHTHFTPWYRRINKMMTWSPEQVKQWQTVEMQKLVHTAYEHSKYYHELFDGLGMKPEDIRTMKDLEQIPPLTKEIIRERFNDILLSNHADYYWKQGATGGSTGNPTRYVKDNNSWGFDNAYNLVMWKRSGYHYGDKFLALGSSSIFPTNKRSLLHEAYYGLKNKIPFNAMNLSEERLEECVKFIVANDIHFIYGYASSIFLLAKYIKDKKLQGKVNIKACFPTSEILTDVYRQTIIDTFGCHIVDSYGANDGGIVAQKLDDEQGYKLGYNCIVQIKQDDCERPNFGTALLTDVTNTVFPFIRYELGDILELGDGYNDFHNGQVLTKVIGRTSDIIVLENGRNLTSPGFTILFKDLNVKGYRIFKSNPMEITLEVVKLPAYTDAEEKLIIDTMHKHAGNDCKVIVNYKDEIVTRKNGKNLFFLMGGGRILIVGHLHNRHLSPFVVEQMEALRRIGHHVEWYGVEGHGVIGYLRNLPALKRKIREFQPDLIHAHYGLSGLCANLQRTVPVVTTYHGSDIHSGGWILKFSQLAMRLSSYNIFISENLLQLSGYKKKNVCVIPCGIDLETIQMIDRNRAKEKMGIKDHFVLFAGSFTNPVKNSDLAKEAMAILSETTLVELKGYSREEVNLLMNAADCLLMTSHREGSPQVIKEAMASGTPIVSVDVGDVKEVMGDTAGCYIAERNANDIAEKLRKALAFQGKTNGRQRIISLGLSNDLVAKQLVKVYEEVVKC